MRSSTEPSGKAVGYIGQTLSEPTVWVGLALFVLAIQSFLVFAHQPWADEYQALLIASEAPNLSTLLQWLRYEGHPPLWYLWLRGLAAILPLTAVLATAAWILAMIGQAIILFVSPFSRLERLLLASSQFFLFEFFTISRGTTLGVVLVLLAFVFWRRKSFWLIVALLPTVDFLFGVMSGVLLVLKWRDRELWWPGIGLWLALSLVAAWSVLPPPDLVNSDTAMEEFGASVVGWTHAAFGWLLKIGSLPVPFQGGINPQWNTPVAPLALMFWALFFYLCWVLTRRHPWHQILVFGLLAFTFLFTLAVYPLGLRHMMLIALLLIMLVWRQRDMGEIPQSAFTGWLVILSICGIATSAISTIKGFDSADHVVAEIEKLGLEDKHWIALPEWRAPAIAGRLPGIEFTRLGEDCTFRFVRWDHRPEALKGPEHLKSALASEIDRHGRSYLVSDLEFVGFDPGLLRPIRGIEPGYSGIAYHLYVIGPDAQEKPVDLQRCYSLKSKAKD